MYLVSFMILLAANAKSVPATASCGVPAKTSSRSPYATCCATSQAFTASSSVSCSHLDRTFVRETRLLRPHNLNHILVLHVLEFLGGCLSHSIVEHRYSRSRGPKLFVEDESFLRRWTEWHSMDEFRHMSAEHISVFSVLLNFEVHGAFRRERHPAPILPSLQLSWHVCSPCGHLPSRCRRQSQPLARPSLAAVFPCLLQPIRRTRRFWPWQLWFLLHFVRLTEKRGDALSACRIVALVYSIASATSLTAKCRSVPVSQGHRHIELSSRCGLWFAFGGPRTCVCACCARRRLWRRKLHHLLKLTGFSCWNRILHRRRCERGAGKPKS